MTTRAEHIATLRRVADQTEDMTDRRALHSLALVLAATQSHVAQAFELEELRGEVAEFRRLRRDRGEARALPVIKLPFSPLIPFLPTRERDGKTHVFLKDIEPLIESIGWQAESARKAMVRDSIEIDMADRFAVALGYHPSHIWEDWHELDERNFREAYANLDKKTKKAQQQAKRHEAKLAAFVALVGTMRDDQGHRSGATYSQRVQSECLVDTALARLTAAIEQTEAR